MCIPSMIGLYVATKLRHYTCSEDRIMIVTILHDSHFEIFLIFPSFLFLLPFLIFLLQIYVGNAPLLLYFPLITLQRFILLKREEEKQ